MSSSILLAVLQIAAGGSLVQILIRFGAFLYKRLSGPEERKASNAADATSVDTAASVLVMVRSELKEVRAQQALERQQWDTERAQTTAMLDNASREIVRVNARLARLTSDLAVAQSVIAELGGHVPGRHAGS